MKMRWASLFLPPLLASAAAAGGQRINLSPEQAAHFQRLTAQVLFWSPQERDRNFRRMDRIFPSIRIAAGKCAHPLPRGRSLIPALGGEHGVDALMDALNEAGLLVLQDGKVRLERYRRHFGPKQRWTSFSVAKSLTSSLVGAAMEDGYIKSIDDPVTRYIPELKGSAYDGVTVEQLLTMTSGVKWNEDYTDPNSDVARMLSTRSPPGENPTVAYLRNLPRDVPRGTKWVYKTGEAMLVGVLVEKATGKTLADYLSQKIWRPYGMESDAFWEVNVDGGNVGGCCVSATLRDYGRIGQFVLDGGKASGKQVLPNGWIKDATSKRADIGEADRGYGYQWWTGANGTYDAIGIFGQLIHVDPKSRLVIVTLSNWPNAVGDDLEAKRWALVERITEVVERR
jgi:CubicO group peptidase (beta-lactamase class C family)